ncbi:4-alpha-glucanotransferase [Jannaschia sp. S6380]|uniref:4-alpha-glucanotransferase n=1 Tax=Jannaschia sp. S6380 TaxID=2926408 RepID=UPI001FF1DF18|nr:4-alpha-glucanotransferase [Jannaschia sp. S6380]MCK0168463.1 4-alpha-glucanotransferase [Jannaschia sp. S6380]
MTLRDLARHHGLTLAYDDPDGGRRAVPDATLRLILRGLGQDPDVPATGPGAPRRMTVPRDARCHLPDSLRDAPGWGIFCQLYELRSDRNWGIGDFADLAQLARICGAAGADFLGINPVHTLFTAAPARCSPFSPSNRRFLNPLYIAPDLLGCERPELPQGDLVDYRAVADAKLSALRSRFDAEGPAAKPVDEALSLHALFETISTLHGGRGWTDWPADLHDPTGSAAQAIAREHADDVAFHVWLQQIARRQLSAAQDAARDAGMRIGLYLDLAVGEAQDGSATWSGTAAALPHLDVGAPPDMFSEQGQNWHLAAPSPTALKTRDFAPYRDMIAAQLQDAGALRIDHAMALWQLFLIPSGRPAAEGTHLRFPMADMLRVLAEESRRANAVVIGEDLGFVPDGFRAAMRRANVLSYRIVYFEQDAKGFHPADGYPHLALACLSTHDLPVLANWWRGDDIDRRAAHGLVSEDTSAEHMRHRARERRDLIAALGVDADPGAPDLPDAVLDAAHVHIARTPCLLAGVRLADLVGPEDPTNLPGVTDAYPNWRPRSPVPIEAIADHPTFQRIAALMRQHRPRP